MRTIEYDSDSATILKCYGCSYEFGEGDKVVVDDSEHHWHTECYEAVHEAEEMEEIAKYNQRVNKSQDEQYGLSG